MIILSHRSSICIEKGSHFKAEIVVWPTLKTGFLREFQAITPFPASQRAGVCLWCNLCNLALWTCDSHKTNICSGLHIQSIILQNATFIMYTKYNIHIFLQYTHNMLQRNIYIHCSIFSEQHVKNVSSSLFWEVSDM